MAGPYRLNKTNLSWSVITTRPSRSMASSSSWVNLCMYQTNAFVGLSPCSEVCRQQPHRIKSSACGCMNTGVGSAGSQCCLACSQRSGFPRARMLKISAYEHIPVAQLLITARNLARKAPLVYVAALQRPCSRCGKSSTARIFQTKGCTKNVQGPWAPVKPASAATGNVIAFLQYVATPE